MAYSNLPGYQYKSQDEWAEELARPRVYGGMTSTQATEPAQPEQPTATSAPAATPARQTATTQPTQAPTAEAPAQPEQAKSPELWPGTLEQPSIDIKPYTPSPTGFGDLFAPVTSQIGKGTEALTGVTKGFTEEVGPYRTWEQIQGPSILQTALRPEPGQETQYLNLAKELANTRYAGPTALSGENYDQLFDYLGKIQDWQGAVGTTGGTKALLQQQSPGLTPGEATFEARLLAGDPAFQQAVQEVQQDIGGFLGQMFGAETQAQQIGERRTQEEDEIQRLARELVTGEIAAIDQDLANQIAEELEYNQRLDDLLAQFQDTPSLKGLETLQPYTEADLGQFRTPTRIAYEEMGPVAEKIMGRYPELADVPLMGPSVSRKGKPIVGWDEDTQAALQAKYGDDYPRIEAMALQRQRDFEGAGFSPGFRSIRDTGLAEYWDLANPGQPMAAGKYGLLNPVYSFGEDLFGNMPNLGAYFGKTQGIEPRRETLATREQRDVYNRANEILGLSDRLAKAETPYEKKQIVAEAGKYLKDEEYFLDRREKQLSKAQQEYRAAVKQARHDYRKAVKRKKWSKALDVVNDVILSAMPAPTPTDVMLLDTFKDWAAGERGKAKEAGQFFGLPT